MSYLAYRLGYIDSGQRDHLLKATEEISRIILALRKSLSK